MLRKITLLNLTRVDVLHLAKNWSNRGSVKYNQNLVLPSYGIGFND